MQEVLDAISSPYWWLGVVLVGIAINLVSHYLAKTLDTRLSSISSWWRNRSEARKAQRLKELEKLRDNPNEQIFLAFSEIRTLIEANFSAIFALMFGMFYIMFRELLPAVTSLRPVRKWFMATLLFLGLYCTLEGLRRILAARYRKELLEDSLSERKPKDDP